MRGRELPPAPGHRPPAPAFVAALLAACAIFAAAAPQQTVADLRRAFEHPPDNARIMARWWWFGPAVEKPELERELQTIKAGGFGGVEVQPVYPVVVDDPARGLRNLPYLSDDFIDALRFAADKARELGLRIDLTLGSGWPYGGPHTPITEAAGKLRIDRVPVAANATTVPMPKIGDGEKFLAAFVNGERLTAIDNGVVTLPSATLAANQVGNTVLFFIASRTRMMVKRPSAGAEGYVLDHYDPAAIADHLKFAGGRLMQAFGKNPPYAVFSDSLEVNNSDWTGNFLAEFQKRRGYDLTPYLPALAGDIGPQTGAIRHDWGKTLTELVNDNYLTPVREWAAQHGTRFRSQTYGVPPVTLSSNGLVDLPEGEGTQWRQFSSTRWATSAGHLYGRPVVSSETWTWLHSPVFRATPLDMKAEADLHFLQGVNQLIAHGYPYSPPQVGEPGWHLYAAAVFNNHNPWWLVMPDITAYLQRVSFLMRQGQPANDVALYLPTSDAYAAFTPGRDSVNQSMDRLIGPNVIPQILSAGYGFDGIDETAIEKVGIPYRILILPGIERIPLASYQKIAEFARKGGTVIATRRAPSLAPGLMEAQSDTPKIQALSQSLLQGHVLTDESQLGEALHHALPADVATGPEIGFVHRKTDSAEIYFLANTSNHPVHSLAVFRVKDLHPAWFDAFTGKVTYADGGSRIDMDLAPYESRVVVFSKERAPESTNAAASSAAAATPALDLSTGWKLTIAGQTIAIDQLRSWSADESTKYFSGTATYEKAANIDASLAASKRPIYLNFGEGTPVAIDDRRAGPGMRAMLESPVHEAAVVTVNGKPAGSVWRPPYEVNVTGLLHAGVNSIQVTVGNLAINEMAKGPLPDYRDVIAKYGDRFQDQDMRNLQPLPSGLLGPIRLMVR